MTISYGSATPDIAVYTYEFSFLSQLRPLYVQPEAIQRFIYETADTDVPFINVCVWAHLNSWTAANLAQLDLDANIGEYPYIADSVCCFVKNKTAYDLLSDIKLSKSSTSGEDIQIGDLRISPGSSNTVTDPTLDYYKDRWQECMWDFAPAQFGKDVAGWAVKGGNRLVPPGLNDRTWGPSLIDNRLNPLLQQFFVATRGRIADIQ